MYFSSRIHSRLRDKNNTEIYPYKIIRNIYIPQKAKPGRVKKSTPILKLSRSLNNEQIPNIINDSHKKKQINYFNKTSKKKIGYDSTLSALIEQNEIGNTLLSGSEESRIKTSRSEYINVLDKDLNTNKKYQVRIMNVFSNSKK